LIALRPAVPPMVLLRWLPDPISSIEAPKELEANPPKAWVAPPTLFFVPAGATNFWFLEDPSILA
jgi:hypothetical protein